jgi:hypothetical protein
LSEDELVNAVAVAAVFQNKCQDVITPDADAFFTKFIDGMSAMVNNQKLGLFAPAIAGQMGGS